ncbi:hypothetical protein [Alteromonas confluentis]|uniref:Heme oxygenase n=1 Tax=Alteromonas confluentis TaxID=1656094 RepID=A0A1E7ZGP0_9ALTE|nr:hypothetical protein [Alteromonas confluentis]OFC72669.1 hypothetical protein BFC18_02125 [Alteromonas confluentis]
MNIDNLFQTLRQQTGQAHRNLEATYPFNQHMRSTSFNAQAYARSLHVLKAFHLAAVQPIALLPAQITKLIDDEHVLSALNTDIAILPSNSDELPVFSIDNKNAPAETAIAFSYVWMGSSMGGSIISKWLQKHHPELPVNYYLSMAGAGSQWEAYKASTLEYARETNVDVAVCAAEAVKVFEGIIQAASCYQADNSPSN